MLAYASRGLGDLTPRSESRDGKGDFRCKDTGPDGWVCAETDSHEERWFLRLQAALAALAGASKHKEFNPGKLDGKVGRKTAKAVAAAAQFGSSYPDARLTITPAESAALMRVINEPTQISVARKADILAVFFERLAGAAVQKVPSGGFALGPEGIAWWMKHRKSAQEAAADAEREVAASIEKANSDSSDATASNSQKEAFWHVSGHVNEAADEVGAAADAAEAGQSATPAVPEPDPDIPAEAPDDLPEPVAESKFPTVPVVVGTLAVAAAVGGVLYYRKRQQAAFAGMG